MRTIPIRYTVEVPITVVEAQQERVTQWCWKPASSFKCSRYKIVMKEIMKKENKTKMELEKHCCEGYVEKKLFHNIVR